MLRISSLPLISALSTPVEDSLLPPNADVAIITGATTDDMAITAADFAKYSISPR